MLVNVLVGEPTERIQKNRLNDVREYGKLRFLSKETVYEIIRWLIKNNFILQTKGEYPVLHPTYNGMHYDETMSNKLLKQLKSYLENSTDITEE